MTAPTVPNAADEAQVQGRKRKAQVQQERRTAALKEVLASRAGRDVIWNLISEAGVYRTSFNTNALAMAHAEGQRNVGLRLLANVMEASLSSYLLMQDEANKEESNG